MLSNGKKNGCGHTDDMIAYIYDEIEISARQKFEAHLATCSSCTDEFAGISDARFSVFEWKKEEFLPLVTPGFELPFDDAAGRKVTASWVDGIREQFTAKVWAFGIVAVMILSVAAGFMLISRFPADDDKIATLNEAITPEPAPSAPVVSGIDLPAGADSVRTEPVVPVRAEKVKPSVAVPQRLRSQRPAAGNRRDSSTKRPSPETRAVKPPVLTDFDDAEDRSLRLADLLDEVDG